MTGRQSPRGGLLGAVATSRHEVRSGGARGEAAAGRLLDLVFDWIRACFHPERTGGQSGVFHYEVSTPGGVRHRWVVVADGRCEVTGEAPADGEDSTIAVELEDLVALAVGEITGSQAFVGGRLKISGDIYFAMNWTAWFGAD
ncbi:SCP2 sterol-binding domain-containing protein [Streptomyces sp. RB6PN25]|uniref:SCP2 sterol-binding domain-containing protein n=1 Tax=Streptomyces humicola TaxID=2953240 RepID=A0ABT1Q4I2_9ACTN|nr:SCP2 sterol-binding domain-containing protein [Streptomyces humicola]MCQ4084293.1 SCP2 sterol-binding domain-containing protein [Streptomyces humicola]